MDFILMCNTVPGAYATESDRMGSIDFCENFTEISTGSCPVYEYLVFWHV